MTLYFPKWIPGTHRAEGNTADLAGLYIRANGRPVPWRRDTLDYYTFHCEVPADARALEVRLDALNVPGTADLGLFDWWGLVLYPAGIPVAQLWCRPAIQLPAGWSCATALDSTGTSPSGIPTLGGCMPGSSTGRSSSTTATPTCCASGCRR